MLQDLAIYHQTFKSKRHPKTLALAWPFRRQSAH